ncbi:IS30 family transposase [Paraburkholderia caledonica]|uniref:IS30 family transposase n=1 Tax=Paraburkholderia caledonica TaxID=134536 RepID=A0AB73IPY9_9BURK|nr:IS30 family transposase [Paraburkholderia caledonica]
MWEHWRKGESLQEIAQLFDRNHLSVQGILAGTGRIEPPQRYRSRWALTLEEREEISRGLVADDSIQATARRLSQAPSTTCREIKRNSGPNGYRANHADQLAWDRARRPKVCKLVQHRKLAHIVAGTLQLQWSPQQIAGGLARAYPGDEDYHVSHEIIIAASSYSSVVP